MRSQGPAPGDLGVGTILIRALEDRIRARGLPMAYLSVEVENVRAAALYEKLCYVACGTEQDSWESRDSSGQLVTHIAECTCMRKQL